MPKKFTISFKNTTKDNELYKLIQGKEEKGEFIKKAIWFYIKHKGDEKEND